MQLKDFRALIAVTAAGSLGAAAIAVADTGLPHIPAHKHFLQQQGELVEVGPRLCSNPKVQKAFDQFHSNIHVPVSGSPGPDGGAPGLHDAEHDNPDVVARGCSFQP